MELLSNDIVRCFCKFLNANSISSLYLTAKRYPPIFNKNYAVEWAHHNVNEKYQLNTIKECIRFRYIYPHRMCIAFCLMRTLTFPTKTAEKLRKMKGEGIRLTYYLINGMVKREGKSFEILEELEEICEYDKTDTKVIHQLRVYLDAINYKDRVYLKWKRQSVFS